MGIMIYSLIMALLWVMAGVISSTVARPPCEAVHQAQQGHIQADLGLSEAEGLRGRRAQGLGGFGGLLGFQDLGGFGG